MKISRLAQKFTIAATAFALLATGLIFPPEDTSAYATAYYDAPKTAEWKVYYNAFYRCVAQQNQIDLKKGNAQSGNIFQTNAIDLQNAEGGWLENVVGGKYEDGKIRCQENDSRIFAKFRDMAGVDTNKIVCGPYNGVDAGVLRRSDDGAAGHCTSFNDNDWTYFSDDYRFRGDTSKSYTETFFAPTIKKYLFGSTNSDWGPTTAEWYYINYNTFTAACGFRNDAESVPYTRFENIAVFGPNGSMETAKFDPYQGNNSFSRSVINFQKHDGTSYNTTCSQLATNMGPDSAEFKAAQNLIYAKINAQCKAESEPVLQLQKRDHEEFLARTDISDADRAASQELLDRINAILNSDTYIEGHQDRGAANCIQDTDLGLNSNVEINPPQDDGPEVDQCLANSGPMGWVVCPGQDALSNAVTSIFSGISGAFLEIDGATLLDTSSGTFAAWQGFQTIANILFVILFLVVIVSQITGIGVSNYGLKKIFPRIIITALLINLSFVICQLAVDLTNILGTALFEFIPSFVPSTGDGGLGAISLLLGAGGALLIGGTIAAAALGGLGAIVPILLLLLSVFLGGLMLMVMLSLRKAAIILLIVISPVAFVCWLLPNTENLFKKWFDIFKTLLVMFPVISVMVGGGILAHNILSAADPENFWMQVFGIVAAVAPIFFIPTMIKSSMSALGTLGAKVTGMSQRIGGFGARQRQQAINQGKRTFNENTKLGQSMQTRRQMSSDAARFRSASRTAAALNKKAASGKQLNATELNMLNDANKTIAAERSMPAFMNKFDDALKTGDTAKITTLARQGRAAYGKDFDQAVGSKVYGLSQTAAGTSKGAGNAASAVSALAKFGSSKESGQFLDNMTATNHAAASHLIKASYDPAVAKTAMSSEDFRAQQVPGDGMDANAVADAVRAGALNKQQAEGEMFRVQRGDLEHAAGKVQQTKNVEKFVSEVMQRGGSPTTGQSAPQGQSQGANQGQNNSGSPSQGSSTPSSSPSSGGSQDA